MSSSQSPSVTQNPRLNTFSLTAFDIGEDGAEDVELNVQVPQAPDIRRHASLALLYGLALMTLDQDGTIENRMLELLEDGMVNEVEAVNRINLLLLKEANDELV